MNADTIAGRYRIDRHMRRIGETDYSAGVDISTGTPVTLRTINIAETGAVGIGLEHLAADKLRRKMENEKRLIAKLDHPGLLDMLDHGFDDPIYFHVYPAFAFHNLHMRIEKSGPLPVDEALGIARAAADTLAALHAMDIIHCDISAETILLLDGDVKVVEFTIASHDQLDGAVPGNPPYMCPEAITGAPSAQTHDVWSLGITLYYALAGGLPFGDIELPREVGAPRLFGKIMTEAPPPITAHVPEASPLLVALLDTMLHKDPAQRAGSMEAVRMQIDTLLTT